MGRQIKDATTTKTDADLADTDFFPGQEAAGGSGSSFNIAGSSLAAWFAANMPAASIAYAKIADMATNKLLGRASAGSGVIEEIDLTPAGRALLDDVDASAQRTTLGLGTAATANTSAFDAAGTASTAVANHVAAGDPHTGYQLESEKNANNGYCGLNASGLVTLARGGTGLALTLGAGELDKSLIVWEPFPGTYAFNLQKVAPVHTTFSASDVLLGRESSGAGDGEEIICTAAGRALLDDANAAAQRTTLSVPDTETGTWTPTTYVGFSADPAYAFTWERHGNRVTLRATTGGNGTSNADTFSFSGSMPAAITPAGKRMAMCVAIREQTIGGLDLAVENPAKAIIHSSGKIALHAEALSDSGLMHFAAEAAKGDGSGFSTVGANAKGIPGYWQITYLL
jgi:hypothetical protein